MKCLFYVTQIVSSNFQAKAMDRKDAFLNVNYLSVNGTQLSFTEKTPLLNSMIIVEKNYKFKTLKLWGKITGIKKNYYIIQGAKEDELKEKKYLYSLNCCDWFLLPPATPESIFRSSLVGGSLVGDPSYEHQYVELHDLKKDETNALKIVIKILEENHLASIVARIDEDTSIVPRGAYIKNVYNEIQLNTRFQGLSLEQCLNFSSYLHFNQAHRTDAKQGEDYDEDIDFLDTIEKEKLLWNKQYHEPSNVVILSSLRWLGMTHFVVPNTNCFGHFYIGNGKENKDLSFML